MGFTLRKDRAGKEYWSFLLYDPERGNYRLKKEEVPAWVKTRADAEEFEKIKQAGIETMAARLVKVQFSRSRYYDFNKLLSIYEAERKLKAPNSWRNDVYWVRYYAFPFFTSQPGGGNLNNWPDMFEDFLDHLLTVSPYKGGKAKTLAYNSKNKIIKALNTFITEMVRRKQCGFMPKVKVFEKRLLTKISAADIYKEEEIPKVYETLKNIDRRSATFFLYLAGTGQRISEGLGASIDCIKSGEPASTKLLGWLKQSKIPSYGYIYLDSQVCSEDANGDFVTAFRKSDGTVLRKPLKSKQDMSALNARTIPISDRELFNCLVALYKPLKAQFDVGAHGKNKRDYLLFDGLTKNIFSTHLRMACDALNMKYRSPHKIRHSYATYLCSKVGGHTGLIRLILGHSDSKITDGYIHLHELVQEEVKRGWDGEGLDFIV